MLPLDQLSWRMRRLTATCGTTIPVHSRTLTFVLENLTTYEEH